MTDIIEVGQTYTVTYAVDNIGDSSGTQDIELKDGSSNVLDSKSEQLSAASDTTGTLEWTPTSSDTGNQTLTLESNDDTEDIPVTVVEAEITVTITDTNSPVVQGDTVTVNVDVTNAGTQTVDTPITLSPADAAGFLDGELVTLAASQTKSITLEWQTSDTQTAQDYTLSVSSVDDSETVTVTVGQSGSGALIDDFEDGNLSEYSGDTGTWQTTSTRVKSGSFAALGPANTSKDSITATDSTLPNTADLGDTVEAFVYLPGETVVVELGLLYNSATGNQIGCQLGGNAVGNAETAIRENGTKLAGDNTGLPNDEWLRVVLDTTAGGSLTLEVFNSTGTKIRTVSASTSNSYGDGLQLQVNSSSTTEPGVYVDAIRLI